MATHIAASKYRIINALNKDNSDIETHLSVSRDVDTEPEDDAVPNGSQQGSPCLDSFQVSSHMWALLVAASAESWNEDIPTGLPPPWNILTRDNSWFCDLTIAQSIRWIRDTSSSLQGFEWARLASSAGVIYKCLCCTGLLSNLALLDCSMAGAVILQALHSHPILRTIDGAKRALAMFMASVPSPDQVSNWISGDASDSRSQSHSHYQTRALEAFLTSECATCLNFVLSSRGQLSFVSQPE